MEKEALKEMLQNVKDAVEEVFGPVGMRGIADQVLIALLDNIDLLLSESEQEDETEAEAEKWLRIQRNIDKKKDRNRL